MRAAMGTIAVWAIIDLEKRFKPGSDRVSDEQAATKPHAGGILPGPGVSRGYMQWALGGGTGCEHGSFASAGRSQAASTMSANSITTRIRFTARV